ncbi:MAG: sigma-70 family RNA polymerase sigma factor [Kofleriaceae bacterium]
MARVVDVTQLLAEWRAGDASAFDTLFPHVYDELHRIAQRLLAGERRGHTLSATALVHEAYVKLVGQDRASLHDRAHFLAIAAVAMRRILVSYARTRTAAKRGGVQVAVPLDEVQLESDEGLASLLAMDDLLDRLAALDERQAQVVIYRYYGGLTDDEIAQALDISAPTVRRAWRSARAWLTSQLGGTAPT